MGVVDHLRPVFSDDGGLVPVIHEGESVYSPLFAYGSCQVCRRAVFFAPLFGGCCKLWPLPFVWLAQLPVPTAALYSQAAAVISPQASLQSIPLSVDSSITSAIALRSAAYFCLYLLLLLVIDSRSRLRMLCYVIVLSGLFQAVYGSFMTLSGIEYLLGVKKITYLGNATGTFVNRNHFAGYLEMTLATGMGLLMVRVIRTGTLKQAGAGEASYAVIGSAAKRQGGFAVNAGCYGDWFDFEPFAYGQWGFF